ncbi:MAG: hypothetical protein IPO88_18115 [Nannocystis sp.]|uniref:hypothetical protein n=1 Tax=Nannocystis sp. TaxID=1962667 RepID=UPI0024239331|nr:hypothetical protein [Nannocystis sp.]MBK9755381.1 hypothetical protein [Nannocystis sp.]
MHLEAGHPDAAHPLLALAARVLEDMGGEVVIHTRDDNLVRSRRDGDPGRAPFIVEAAGLPNLLHELVHVLQFGRLADDHGLDYGQIPFDLADPAQRRFLWEELACCVVSCAYLEPAAEAPWFAEQVGIQGVFFGHEDDEPGFLAVVDRIVAAHGAELEAVIAAAYAEVERCLARVGAGPGASPRAHLQFSPLWARFRADHAQ